MQAVDQIIAAEVLAISVCDLFPGAQLVEGNGTQIGFFYDFAIDQPIDEKAIPLLEEKMRGVIKADLPVQILDMMRENAAQLLLHHHQSIKAELVVQDQNNIVQIVKINNFHDHIPTNEDELAIGNSTSLAAAIKILSIKPVTRFIEHLGELSLIRIEGIAAHDRQVLKKAFKRHEAAKQHHHMLTGQEMKLFTPCPEALNSGVFWHPKGVILRDLLMQFWQDAAQERGFQRISTPGIMKHSLQEHHLNKKQKTDFNTPSPTFEMEETEHIPAPNKTLLHAQYIASQVPYYQELPVRLAESSERFEAFKDIQIEGLYHTRLYTADYLTVFCAEDQIQRELISSLHFFDKTFRILDFEYQWYLVASRGKASIGTAAEWKQGAAWLAEALSLCGFSCHHESRQSANAGPRIELRLRDPLDRQWVASWLEINWLYPKQFDLRYRDVNNKIQPLVMINGSLYGSVERLIALLIEHHRGQLPLWLAPEQIRLLPMGQRHVEHAQAISTRLKNAGFRAGIDLKEETLGCKVHAAEKARIPYIVILGDKEKKEKKLTVRSCRQNKTVNSSMQLEHLLEQLETELAGRPKI